MNIQFDVLKGQNRYSGGHRLMELKISYQKLRTSELQNFEILNF